MTPEDRAFLRENSTNELVSIVMCNTKNVTARRLHKMGFLKFAHPKTDHFCLVISAKGMKAI
jgi:hypothetical protein